MIAIEKARAAPARADGDPQECHSLAGVDSSKNSNSCLNIKDLPSHANLVSDQRLLAFDFLGEVGDLILALGAAIGAAAAAENLIFLELALRTCRTTLLDGIAEFRALSGNRPVSEALHASTAFREAAREYREGRIAR